MRIGVITPNFASSHEWLRQCGQSVRQQQLDVLHILVQDGGELAYGLLPLFDQVVRLPVTLADTGNTPRAIGSLIAISQGCDAIAWLDSDNWFLPGHLKTLLDLHQRTGADICTSSRGLYDLQGARMGRCPEIDGERFVDTNCFVIFRRAFPLVHVWTTLPRALHSVGDRVFWEHIRRSSLRHAHINEETVAYRTNYRCHYVACGVPPPAGAKPSTTFDRHLIDDYFQLLNT